MENGLISGRLSGRVLAGHWAESSASARCGTPRVDRDGNETPHWGQIRFVFNDDMTQFCGFWSGCDAEPRSAWNGWRPPAERPTGEDCKVILGTHTPNGSWSASSFSQLSFETDGTTVTGLYNPGESGLLTGTLAGHEVTGLWVETRSAVTCESQRLDREGNPSAHWGHVRITFNPNFTQLCGTWRYCGREPEQSTAWQGNHLSVPTTTCQEGRPVE